MDYIIKRTDPTTNPFTIKPYTINGPDLLTGTLARTPEYPINAVSANTSLVLLGKGMHDYGEIIAENFVRLMENFSNGTAPIYPIRGQLWHNSTSGALNVYNGATWDSLLVSGQFTSSLNLSTQRIINLADPVDAQDAVTKNFADATYVNVGGDTMTGSLTISTGANLVLEDLPTLGTHAANKNYVDGVIDTVVGSTYVPLSGGTVTGTLTFAAGAQIVLTDAPTIDSNATTKAYVDAADADILNTLTTSYLPITGGNLTNALTIDSGNLTITAGSIILTSGSLNLLNGVIAVSTGSYVDIIDAPTLGTHAANKDYVDLVVGSAGGTLFAHKVGDVFNGPIVYDGTGTNGGISIVAVTPASSTFAVDGDKSNIFVSGVRFIITNNSGLGAPIKYSVASSAYDTNTSTTVISVNETIVNETYTITAVDQVLSKWTVTGIDAATTFATYKKFTVSGNTGGGDGVYTIVSAIVNGSDTEVVVSETIPVGSTADGIMTVTPAADGIITSSITAKGAPVTVDADVSVVGLHAIDVGSNRIQSVAEPIEVSDAATKGYVDDALIGSVGTTLVSGSMDTTTNTLTLVNSSGPNVVVSNVAAGDHIQESSTVFHDSSSTNIPNSRFRTSMKSVVGYPHNSVKAILDGIDADLYTLMHANDRMILPVATMGVTAVSAPLASDLALTAVSNVGGDAVFTVVGDYTTTFITGISFTISGNTDIATNNVTWIVISSAFVAGNTEITVSGNTTATVTGNIDRSYGALKVSGDATTSVANKCRINLSATTGGTGDGDYYLSVVKYTASGNYSFLYIASTTPLPVGTDAGTIQQYSYAFPFNFTVGSNKVMVHDDGVKKYNHTRGFANIKFLTTLNDTSPAPFTNGSYSFDVAVDGAAAVSIPIIISDITYTIVDVNLTNNTFSISGNVLSTFVTGSTFVVTGNTGGGNGTYTVVSASFTNFKTVVRVSEIIPVGTTADGTISYDYTISNLVDDMNDQFATLLSSNCIAVFDNNAIWLYSATSGTSSQITITDVTLFAAATPVPTITNYPPGVSYAYSEVGTPTTSSNIIEFVSLPTIGHVLEFINTK